MPYIAEPPCLVKDGHPIGKASVEDPRERQVYIAKITGYFVIIPLTYPDTHKPLEIPF